MELIATSRNGGNGLLALDPAEAKACSAAIRDHKPDWVLNAGAYTAVDKAESEPELAMAVNGGTLRAFAEALLDAGGSLLQVSTDLVFNGQQGSPYRPEQSRDSLGTYGRTKAAGEEAVEAVLGGSGLGVILRTSRVIGPAGKNLALTMLRLPHQHRHPGGGLLAGDGSDGAPMPTGITVFSQRPWGSSSGAHLPIQPSATSICRWTSPPSVLPSVTGRSLISQVVSLISISCV